MATQVNTKVRLVKCPKCRKLLAELPDISVYKCGGCGTVLQAKIRKQETNISGLSSQETVSASKSQLDDVPNHDLTCSPKVESSSDRSLPDRLSSSRDVSSPRSEDSLPQVNKSPEYPLGQDPEGYQSKLHDDNEDKDEESQRVLDGVSNHDSPKVKSSLDRSASDGLSSLRDITSPRSEDLPLQVKESPKYPLGQDPEGYVRELHDSNGERAADSSFSNELSSSSEITHEDEAYVPEESELVEKYDQQESTLPERVRNNCAPSESDEKSSADQNGELAHENGVENDESIRASGSPLNGSFVSFYLTTDDEHLNHSPGRPARNFERVSSIDTVRSSHLNSELNFPRNGSYYSYDGSESSYDGTYYQNPDHISHPARKNRGLDHMRKSEVLRKDIFRGNNHAMINSHWNQGTSTEANKYNAGHRIRFDNQHNLRPPRPAFNLQDPPLYSDPEKIDLLRTVCELKDQLNRMQFPKVSSNQRFPDGNFSAFRHDHIAPDLNPVKACGERCKVSRMAFSAEAAHYRRPISCSCLHYSAQLPSCSMHCKNGHHVVHTDHNSYNSYNSYNSPSPHHYTSSELSLHGCDSKSETQRLDEMKRLHLREKYKRHLRPIAGGAPVIACYHCWEVLQLPMDFLLFKKRYHKLMCNGCKKVLKFSILKGTHIVPYNDSSAPPPSEADDFSNAGNLDPPSRSSFCHHVDPVSYSDDYGREFCRSCSTEEEALGVVPSLERVQRELYHRKMSSGSSHQPMEDRKMKGVLMDSPNSVESIGPSSRTPKFRKFTSEIEEVEPSSTSPLHRLMGYPSPSHVLSR